MYESVPNCWTVTIGYWIATTHANRSRTMFHPDIR
jgi:hypothetical protein